MSAPLQLRMDYSGHLPIRAQLGMQQAEDSASDDFKAVILGCVLAVARRKSEVCADDVMAEYLSLPDRPFLHRNAMGPLIVRAWRDGILKPTDRVARSQREGSRGHMQRIWQSNYFKEAR